MDLWTAAHDDLNAIDIEEVATSVDQRLKVAEIEALLAIGQLLSKIQDGSPGAWPSGVGGIGHYPRLATSAKYGTVKP